MGWRAKAGWSAGGVLLLLLGWAVLARGYAPQSNSNQNRFDAIIVLGYPADSDGNPSPTQLARVIEGVREYERGIAPRLIMTGGPAHNRFVEAQIMAQAAQAQGIPASAILVEPRAEDTIQNACYAQRIMKQHGWHSAEVVSSGYHLARSAMIFDKLPLKWRTHEAPALEPPSPTRVFEQSAMETIKTMRYLVYAQWADRCEP
jgi:uncharacterized SAM-binding protein YcdF (DUF218 family)